MKDNWVIDAAKKADGGRGYVLLEDPASKTELDYFLTKRFWPFIRSRLEESGYSYQRRPYPTELEMGLEHERSLDFMLFDRKKPIFRGTLKISRKSWMVESEFFLLLKKETDHRVIFELLGNSRLVGMPPELHIYKNDKYYFQITFKNGQGAGGRTLDEESAKIRIKKVIDINVAMYEMSRSGLLPPARLGQFLSTALRFFSASVRTDCLSLLAKSRS